jgi:hypothetical protein
MAGRSNYQTATYAVIREGELFQARRLLLAELPNSPDQSIG